MTRNQGWLAFVGGAVLLAVVARVVNGPDAPRPTPTVRAAAPTADTRQLPTVAPTTAPAPTAVPATATNVPATTAPTQRPATAAPTAAARVQTTQSAPCFVGQIKANRNSGIYHVPGGASYAQTTANVACYDTEAQAQAAGFRRAER